MEVEDVKGLHDKFESILSNLKSQFAKFVEERDNRETALKEEATQIEMIDMPVSTKILNFLEWDSTALLLEEQRIETFENYVEKLYEVLRDVKSQKETIIELTEELETKEEDLNLMSDKIREREKELKIAKEERDKLFDVIKKSESKPASVPQKPVQQIPITEELDSPYSSLFEEATEPPPKKNLKKRMHCKYCNKEIFRKTDAKYCIECAYIKRKESDIKSKVKHGRIKITSSKYDKKGDVISEKDEPEDEEQDFDEGEDDENGEKNEDEK